MATIVGERAVGTPPGPAPAGPIRSRRWSLLLGWVAAAVFCLGAGMALIGGSQLGISTDEPVHQSRLNTWFDTGWYVPSRFLGENDQPKPTIDPGRLHAYGGGFSIVGHAVAVTTGAEQWGTTERTAAAYNARHVTLALLGAVAAAAAGFATSVATGSRLAGLWTAAAAMAIPAWTGYSMFAVKDIPAAAGWTLATAGLVVALHPAPRRRRWLLVAALCAVGVWFSVGVRTALWVPMLAGVLVFAVLALARGRPVRGGALAALAGLAAGLAAVAVMHRHNAAAGAEWLLSAVRTSGDFSWAGTTLTAGELLRQKPPWWYLPAWIGGSVPLLLGVLAAVGLGAVAVGLLRRPPGDHPGRLLAAVRGRLGSPSAVVSLWGVQALLLPVAATLAGATMYAGLRHHLYALPALAALAGFAAAGLLRAWPGRWPVVALLAAVLVLPMAEQVPLYPYQFVYKNVLAAPVNDEWESDLHFVSGREALGRIPAGAQAWCFTKVSRDPPNLRECRRQRQVKPYLSEQGRAASGTSRRAGPVGSDPAWVWVVGRRYRGNPLPDGCVEAASVTRWLRGERVIMAYVVRCPATLLRPPAPS